MRDRELCVRVCAGCVFVVLESMAAFGSSDGIKKNLRAVYVIVGVLLAMRMSFICNYCRFYWW